MPINGRMLLEVAGNAYRFADVAAGRLLVFRLVSDHVRLVIVLGGATGRADSFLVL